MVGGQLLSGCVQGPDYHPPVPEGWSRAWPGAALRSDGVTWWAAFGDPVLSGLIERAREGNADGRVAFARIAESRAALAQAGVPLLPTAEGSASYDRERARAKGVQSLAGRRGSTVAKDHAHGGR